MVLGGLWAARSPSASTGPRNRDRPPVKDPLLLLLLTLMVATLAAFLVGLQPYPSGWLVLAVLITARVLQRRIRGGS